MKENVLPLKILYLSETMYTCTYYTFIIKREIKGKIYSCLQRVIFNIYSKSKIEYPRILHIMTFCTKKQL